MNGKSCGLIGLLLAGLSAACSGMAGIEDQVVDDICFPEGNLLVWSASLGEHVQAKGAVSPIRIDPRLPRIKSGTGSTNTVQVSCLAREMQASLLKSLVPTNSVYGVWRVHPALHVKYIKVREVLDLMETVFDCRVYCHDDEIIVRLFPEEMEVVGYTCDRTPSRDVGELIGYGYSIGSFDGDPFDGLFSWVAKDKIVYVTATSDKHAKALQRLREMRLVSETCATNACRIYDFHPSP